MKRIGSIIKKLMCDMGKCYLSHHMRIGSPKINKEMYYAICTCCGKTYRVDSNDPLGGKRVVGTQWSDKWDDELAIIYGYKADKSLLEKLDEELKKRKNREK